MGSVGADYIVESTGTYWTQQGAAEKKQNQSQIVTAHKNVSRMFSIDNHYFIFCLLEAWR